MLESGTPVNGTVRPQRGSGTSATVSVPPQARCERIGSTAVLDCTYRVRIPHRPGQLARVAQAIADRDGLIGDVVTVNVGREASIREITVEVRDKAQRGPGRATLERARRRRRAVAPRPRVLAPRGRQAHDRADPAGHQHPGRARHLHARRGAGLHGDRGEPSAGARLHDDRAQRSRSAPTARACWGWGTSGRSRRCR